MPKNRTAAHGTRQETHSSDLGLAEDQLGVTIDCLQWGGDADAQSFAADALRELSDSIRALFELDVDPLHERNEIFHKKLGYSKRWTIHEADLKAHELARCADAHMRMIRGVRKETIAAIREALAYVQLDGLPPDLDHGIFNAKLKGIVAGKGLETPYKLWDVTLGDMADRGEEHTVAEHDFAAREKAYVRAVFNKLRRLK